MRDNSFETGLNTNLDIGSVMFKSSFAIFVLKQLHQVFTKLDVTH